MVGAADRAVGARPAGVRHDERLGPGVREGKEVQAGPGHGQAVGAEHGPQVVQ